ncbi:BC1881 family protein [Paenibacillus sp. YSY-4.3]
MNQSTKELTKELAGREGIEVIKVNPHEEFKITTGQKEMKLTGPAIILINQD